MTGADPEPDPVLCPIHPALVERLRHPDGWTVTGGIRISLDSANVLNIEVIHDCFVMNCQHNGPELSPGGGT